MVHLCAHASGEQTGAAVLLSCLGVSEVHPACLRVCSALPCRQAAAPHESFFRVDRYLSICQGPPGSPWLRYLQHWALPWLQEGSIYDYLFDKAQCGWRHWMDTVPVQEVPTSAAFHEIIVQTIDTVRYTYLLNMLVSHGYHTLFTGGPAQRTHRQRSGCLPISMAVVVLSCGLLILSHPSRCCSCRHPP